MKRTLTLIVVTLLVFDTNAQSDAQWRAVTVGLSNPAGKFYQNNLTIPIDQAVGAKPGFYLSYEGANYFTETSNLKIGFSFMTSVAMNQVNWNQWVRGATSFSGSPFILGEIKLGLIGTYDLSDDMHIDCFARVGDNVGNGGGGTWESSSSSVSFKPAKIGIGYGTNFGLNFRFKKYIATVQMNSGKIKIKYDYTDYSSFAEVQYSLPVTSFHAGVGMTFGNY